MNTNKNTIIIALIVLVLIIGTGYKAVFWSEDSVPTLDELRLQARNDLMDQQQRIDTHNLMALSACIEEAKDKAPKASEQIKYQNDCFEKNKRRDIDIEKEMERFTNSWTLATGSTVVPERKQVNLRSIFSLWDCRFTNDNHKLPKYNLDWLAYDIACTQWESFGVSAPSYGSGWIVEKIGYGSNLWSFIILKWSESNMRIVYGHTVVDEWIKEWEVIVNGGKIWKTNLSWASTGMHLHIEIWEGTDIVSRERFWSPTWDKQDQRKLLEHRKWDFGQKKKILRDGKELEALTYAWEKYWDMDFIKTVEAESRWDQYAVWDAGDAYWYCQINKNYNPEMQNEYRSLKTPQARIDYCYAQYKTWVDKGIIHKRLYGYNVRNLPQNNKFTFK